MVAPDRFLMYAQEVRYSGPLEGATHHGLEGEPGEGAFLEIWLKIEDGVIRQAAYRTHGCPSSRATGSAICQLVSTGMRLEKAMEISSEDLILLVGGLPEGKGHFALMTLQALKQAIGVEPLSPTHN